MVAVMMLAAALSVQEPSTSHVRSAESKISALLKTGVERSATFRHLVETLDASDVVVYVEIKRTRGPLGGFLSHNVVDAGGHRYLRIALEMVGTERALISLLAHELQHALEVAQDPEARNADAVDRLFKRLAFASRCGPSNCSETAAALDVQAAVRAELEAKR